MVNKKISAKIKHFCKDKLEPNSMLIASVALIITLFFVLIRLLNSLETIVLNNSIHLWFFTLAFGLGSLSYIVIRLISLYKQTKSFAKQAVDVAERAMNITDRLLEAVEKPRNPQVLIERFLSIKSIFIYYIDKLRVNDLYQKVVGRKQLQTVTEEWVKEQGSSFSVGHLDVLRGEINDNSTNKTSATSEVQKPGLDETFLTVQSSFLRLDNVAVGYEYSLYQIENNNDGVEIDDFEKWSSRESERLNSLSGLILLDTDFLVQELDSPHTKYQLTSTRPLVHKSVVDSTVTFRITISKDLIQVNEQLILNNHLGGKIKFHVFGYVTIKPNDYTEKENLIDVAPLVIYT